MPYPFDRTGTEVGPDGIRRYTDLPQNLLQMLRSAVDGSPDAEALVELGGDRVTYRQLWERAARVAGGLRGAGVQPGDRVANRLGNGADWVLAFWGPCSPAASSSRSTPASPSPRCATSSRTPARRTWSSRGHRCPTASRSR